MRIWHKWLVPVLPQQQLIGQWRELCLVAKNISEKGTPNHVLCNRVMEYPISHLCKYARLVADEMRKRDYICDWWKFEQWIKCDEEEPDLMQLFKGWHNDRYLLQCYYNLQEKYDCGGMAKENWMPIEEKCAPRLFWWKS